MKLYRNNTYSKKVTCGLMSAIIALGLLTGCKNDEETSYDIPKETIAEENINEVSDNYLNFYNISEKEREERIKGLDLKYPDSKCWLVQVSSIAVKDKNGNYKLIQGLERYNESTDSFTVYDLFTEEKLFEIPYDSYEVDMDTFAYKNVDFDSIYNKSHYFDDKEIVEYGISLHTVWFINSHFDEITKNKDSNYKFEMPSDICNYLYPEKFKIEETFFTKEELADNYVTVVPKELQVNAKELGLHPTYEEKRKYADYWRISKEEKLARMLNFEIKSPEKEFYSGEVQTLIFKDNEEIKLMNVFIANNGNKIDVYDLYTEIKLFDINNSDLVYDKNSEQYVGLDFNSRDNSIEYFKDKEIIKLTLSTETNWYIRDYLEYYKNRDGIDYTYPDEAFLYYLYPYGKFDTSTIKFNKMDYADCYLTMVPIEAQVSDAELLEKIDINHDENKIYLKNLKY